MPMPLARAIGKLATSPISTQHTAAASAVHATAEFCGTPAEARILGLTNRMYAIVRNVATAPRTSRPTVLPRAAMAKRRSRTAAKVLIGRWRRLARGHGRVRCREGYRLGRAGGT